MTDNKQIAHSPTPWTAKHESIQDPEGILIAAMSAVYGLPEAQANATHIVRCVNAHQGLVDALKDARCCLEIDCETLLDDEKRNQVGLRMAETRMLINIISKTLRLAEGGE